MTARSVFSGFISAIQTVFTVYGGTVAASGAVTLSGAGLILGDACALLFIVCLLTSGATWIMGSDRALAVSCYDGAGPRTLGVINARFGTPVRVNVFSGVVATIVVILATCGQNCFIVVGVFFWWRGRRTREWAAQLAADVSSADR